MKFTIHGEAFSIPESVILGICKICRLPMTTGEVYDHLLRKVDDEVLFHFVNVCGDVHEICPEEPDYLKNI